MKLTLRQLAIFAAIAETGSTTAAGEHIALSQSAISAALNELEKLLETRLFDRVGTRLALNDTGRALLPQARAVLQNAADIERDFGARAQSGGVTALRVGASTTIGNYLLPTIIANYQRVSACANIDVQIGNTSDVVAAVAHLKVDMGLIEGPCHEAELTVKPWREDEMVIVGAPTHALLREASTRRVGVEALRQAKWLLREPGSGTREVVEHALLAHLHHVQQGMQFGATEAIKQAAAQGLGLACLSLCAVDDLMTLGRLVRVRTTLPRLRRWFYLVHHRRKQISRSLARFIAHCETTPV